MQLPEPQAEHQWLQQLVGEWLVEGECDMGTGQSPSKTTSRETVRALGALWIMGEGANDTSGGSCDYVMTLGYDPQAKRFVGTFVASAMTHLWPYRGQLDASGRRLILDSEGPSFSGDGTMAKYQDIIEIIDEDSRILSAQVMGDAGQWKLFMKSYYRRNK